MKKTKELSIRWMEGSISCHCSECHQYVTYQAGPALFHQQELICDRCASQFRLGWLLILFWIGVQESEEMEPGLDEPPQRRARLIFDAMNHLMSVANTLRQSLSFSMRSEVKFENLNQLSDQRNGAQQQFRIPKKGQ